MMLSSSSLRALLFVVLLCLRWLVSLCYITIPIALYLLLLTVVNLFLSFLSFLAILCIILFHSFIHSVVVSSTIMSKNVYINNEMRRAFWFSMRSHCWKFYDSDKFLLPFSTTTTQHTKNKNIHKIIRIQQEKKKMNKFYTSLLMLYFLVAEFHEARFEYLAKSLLFFHWISQ